MLISYSKRDDFNYYLGIFAMLMSFNSILLFGVNASLIVFAIMAFKFSPQLSIFNINSFIQVAALLFFAGVVTSTLDIDTGMRENGMQRAMAVLPNYLYWCLLTVLLVNIRHKINWGKIGVFIAYGIVLTLFFYSIRKSFTTPMIKNNTPNSYAFVLVCFSAISVRAVKDKYGLTIALVLLAFLLLSLLGLERRAGFILVMFSSVAALSLEKIRFQYLVIPIIVMICLFIALQLDFVENAILNSSPRIHELIYENEDIATTDQSLLTRKLMIERGLKTFSEHPFSGVGMNNYSLVEVSDDGNFEGYELIEAKSAGHTFSAHNSYILFLVEGGLAIMIPFILLLGYNLFFFIKDYNNRPPIVNAYYWSFASMCIHIYFLSEIVNVYAWFLIAAVSSISVKYYNIKFEKQEALT